MQDCMPVLLHMLGSLKKRLVGFYKLGSPGVHAKRPIGTQNLTMLGLAGLVQRVQQLLHLPVFHAKLLRKACLAKMKAEA